jgi:hypothetical protein
VLLKSFENRLLCAAKLKKLMEYWRQVLKICFKIPAKPTPLKRTITPHQYFYRP